MTADLDLARDRLAVALDTPALDAALRLAACLEPLAGTLKLGLEFFCAHGPEGVRAVMAAAPRCRLFLDLKLHDIPNTVSGAVLSVAPLRPAFLTVHAGGGGAMLAAARAAAAAETRVLAVTVLTSLDADDLTRQGVTATPTDQVVRLAGLATAAGCDGLVCAPTDLGALRRTLARSAFLVVPGIRPAGADRDDQKRSARPAEAIAAGADLLVVGRPVTAAADPAAAAATLLAEIAGSLTHAG